MFRLIQVTLIRVYTKERDEIECTSFNYEASNLLLIYYCWYTDNVLKDFSFIRNAFCYKNNLLKPTGHVMHQQFNIQQLYVLPTLYLCVLYLSKNKQRLVPLTA